MRSDWWVVIPLKDTRVGKSRLGLPAAQRRLVAIAMLRDTVSAVLATPIVSGVVLVCDEARDAALLHQPGVIAHVDPHPAGLNAAIASGELLARRLSPGCNLAAVPGDLASLRSTELVIALELARQHPRSFVADDAGTGTTLLTAGSGEVLQPAYGHDSRLRHGESGAVELRDPRLHSLRHDVDDLAALRRAVINGGGQCTKRAFAAVHRAVSAA